MTIVTVYDVWPKDYSSKVREAIAIRWLISTHDGNASKTAVEDVMILRHPTLGRVTAHEIMNDIERHQLDLRACRHNDFDGAEPPQLGDYPEILQADIRWYKGKPTAEEELS